MATKASPSLLQFMCFCSPPLFDDDEGLQADEDKEAAMRKALEALAEREAEARAKAAQEEALRRAAEADAATKEAALLGLEAEAEAAQAASKEATLTLE